MCFLIPCNILGSSDGPSSCSSVWLWVLTFDVHLCVNVLLSALHPLLVSWNTLMVPFQPSLVGRERCAQLPEVCL